MHKSCVTGPIILMRFADYSMGSVNSRSGFEATLRRAALRWPPLLHAEKDQKGVGAD